MSFISNPAYNTIRAGVGVVGPTLGVPVKNAWGHIFGQGKKSGLDPSALNGAPALSPFPPAMDMNDAPPLSKTLPGQHPVKNAMPALPVLTPIVDPRNLHVDGFGDSTRAVTNQYDTQIRSGQRKIDQNAAQGRVDQQDIGGFYKQAGQGIGQQAHDAAGDARSIQGGYGRNLLSVSKLPGGAGAGALMTRGLIGAHTSADLGQASSDLMHQMAGASQYEGAFQQRRSQSESAQRGADLQDQLAQIEAQKTTAVTQTHQDDMARQIQMANAINSGRQAQYDAQRNAISDQASWDSAQADKKATQDAAVVTRDQAFLNAQNQVLTAMRDGGMDINRAADMGRPFVKHDAKRLAEFNRWAVLMAQNKDQLKKITGK